MAASSVSFKLERFSKSVKDNIWTHQSVARLSLSFGANPFLLIVDPRGTILERHTADSLPTSGLKGVLKDASIGFKYTEKAENIKFQVKLSDKPQANECYEAVLRFLQGRGGVETEGRSLKSRSSQTQTFDDLSQTMLPLSPPQSSTESPQQRRTLLTPRSHNKPTAPAEQSQSNTLFAAPSSSSSSCSSSSTTATTTALAVIPAAPSPLSTGELGELVKEILCDPSFPAFVEEVNNILHGLESSGVTSLQ